MTFEELLKYISTDKPFALSRWGDGEWFTTRGGGPGGENCDGNIYYKDLGERLKEIVSKKQDYYMSCQHTLWAEDSQGNLVSDSNLYEQDWFDSDLLHKASKQQKLNELIQILYKKIVVYIGNSNHSRLKFVDEFVEIPPNNVWKIYDKTLEQIKESISSDHKIFLLSAGMCANVFVHDLWNYNNKNTYIDVGSALDPYAGIHSRGYMKKLDQSYISDI